MPMASAAFGGFFRLAVGAAFALVDLLRPVDAPYVVARRHCTNHKISLTPKLSCTPPSHSETVARRRIGRRTALERLRGHRA